MNETRITVHGNVVNEPITRSGRNGSVFTTFRIGTTPYRRTGDGKFLDLDTSFYNVIAFNALAANAASSLSKGQPVIVEGNLSTKTYLGSDGVSRTSSEIEADHIGHDLKWGRASFLRLSKAAALGLDPTASEEVRNALEEMDGTAGRGSEAGRAGAPGDSVGRPHHVDANGEVHDGLAPAVADDGYPGGPPAGFPGDLPGDFPGDPETDDYSLEEPAA